MQGLGVRERTFLDITEMGLGTSAWGDRFFWQYGNDYTYDDIYAAFQMSLQAGVNLVDTAEIYGSGRSEHMLGQFMKDTQKQVMVATKFFPMPYRFSKHSVVNTLKGSLERLGLEQVYLYQLHWPSPIVSNEVYLEGLAATVDAGLAKAVGVSNYDIKQMQQANIILTKFGISLASNQVEFNLLNRHAEKSGLLKLCKETGIRLIAYSPLAQGLLTGKYTVETPPKGIRGRKYSASLRDLPALISLMSEIGESHDGKTPGQVAINWVICKGGLPIPGAKNAEQARQNIGAVGWRLTQEEIDSLDVASEVFSK